MSVGALYASRRNALKIGEPFAFRQKILGRTSPKDSALAK
jgi:hypothetical protein